MTKLCQHCPPDSVWPHEHVGDTTLRLLLIARDEVAHKEWYFHGTLAQCEAFLNHKNSCDQERFENLLLLYMDWDKALEAFS